MSTATLADLRVRAGLGIKELAVELNLPYSAVYSAEKYEGQELKRNRLKYEELQKKMRLYLERVADEKEREVLSRRTKHVQKGDEDEPSLQVLRDKANAELAKRMGWCPDGWERHTEWEEKGISCGQVVHVDAEDGSFVFFSLTVAPKSTWVDCFGGARNEERFRSFAPERVHA